MAHWFLNTRAQLVGGSVAPQVAVLDADRPGDTGDLASELVAEVRGRAVFLATHGFNVHQAGGIASLGAWMDNLQIGNAVPIGILWPGDAAHPIFVDYVVEGKEAIEAGNLLATFLNDHLQGAVSLSFASHSLGARVVLQTISAVAPAFTVARLVLMAGAIDDTCLNSEYQAAANRVTEISLLASQKDAVLELAYPLGNPLQGIIDRGHPYWHAALGREGPAQPYPPGARLQPDWMIPDNLNYGHLDYMPGGPVADRYPLPVDIPPMTGPMPPAATPVALQPPVAWKPGFSAGFASTRFMRP